MQHFTHDSNKSETKWLNCPIAPQVIDRRYDRRWSANLSNLESRVRGNMPSAREVRTTLDLDPRTYEQVTTYASIFVEHLLQDKEFCATAPSSEKSQRFAELIEPWATQFCAVLLMPPAFQHIGSLMFASEVSRARIRRRRAEDELKVMDTEMIAEDSTSTQAKAVDDQIFLSRSQWFHEPPSVSTIEAGTATDTVDIDMSEENEPFSPPSVLGKRRGYESHSGSHTKRMTSEAHWQVEPEFSPHEMDL